MRALDHQPGTFATHRPRPTGLRDAGQGVRREEGRVAPSPIFGEEGAWANRQTASTIFVERDLAAGTPIIFVESGRVNNIARPK